VSVLALKSVEKLGGIMEENMSFEFMQSTVDDVCRSLRENPTDWRFETYTFYHKDGETQFWASTGTDSCQYVWRNNSRCEVFSYEQGEQIMEAYNAARTVMGSKAQQAVLKEFKKQKKEPNIFEKGLTSLRNLLN
jgi:hypothetical protein